MPKVTEKQSQETLNEINHELRAVMASYLRYDEDVNRTPDDLLKDIIRIQVLSQELLRWIVL